MERNSADAGRGLAPPAEEDPGSPQRRRDWSAGWCGLSGGIVPAGKAPGIVSLTGKAWAPEGLAWGEESVT